VLALLREQCILAHHRQLRTGAEVHPRRNRRTRARSEYRPRPSRHIGRPAQWRIDCTIGSNFRPRNTVPSRCWRRRPGGYTIRACDFSCCACSCRSSSAAASISTRLRRRGCIITNRRPGNRRHRRTPGSPSRCSPVDPAVRLLPWPMIYPALGSHPWIMASLSAFRMNCGPARS
jgi:hypothetical protein